MFTSASPGDADAAFVRLDDPNSPEIADIAAASRLRVGRTVLEHGLLPTEYFDSAYVVAFPGGAIARCNPVTAPPSCTNDQLSE